ncbi:hypothetical protein Tco_0915951 [Tanacetum coccineum]
MISSTSSHLGSIPVLLNLAQISSHVSVGDEVVSKRRMGLGRYGFVGVVVVDVVDGLKVCSDFTLTLLDYAELTRLNSVNTELNRSGS